MTNQLQVVTSRDCDGHPKEPPKFPADTSTQIECARPAPQAPVLSKKRWSILVAVCAFGLSVSLTGDTGPILDQVLKLLDLSVDNYVYIGQIFTYLIAITAIPSAIFMDRFGIRTTVYVAACCFVLQGTFTSLLYFTELPGWSRCKMYFYLTARFFGTQCFAIFFLLPLKVSETWFAESERSTAWMAMFIQLEIGSCLVSFLYPRLINGIDDFRKLAYVNMTCVFLTLVTSIGLVTKSQPASPPSVRAAKCEDIVPMLESVRRILGQRDILVHMIHSSIHAALSVTMGSVLQDMLSSIGHSQIFTGNYMLINTVISTVLCVVMATFVHKIQNATLACKIGSILQSVQFIILLIAIASKWSGWVIVGTSVVLTLFKSWTTPNFNNMTAHLASGVISQPKMIGLTLALSPVIMSSVQVTFAYLIEIKNKKNNYHNSLMFLIAICAVNEAVYQLFFQGKSSVRPDQDRVPVVDAEAQDDQ